MKRPWGEGVKPVNMGWLLEESSEIIYVCDFNNYSLCYMNQGARDLFGINQDEYVGRKCYDVLQRRSEPCEFCTNTRLREDQFYCWKFRNEVLGKTLLLRDRIVDWYGTKARIEFATDVSAIDQKNKQLEEQVAIDRTIISCLRILNGAQNLEEASNIMLKTVAEFYDAKRAFILEYSEESDILTVHEEWVQEGTLAIRDIIGEEGIKPDAYMQECLHNHKNYCQKITEPTAYLKEGGVTEQLGVPFYLKGKPVGMIGVDNPSAFKGKMGVLETLSYFITEERARTELSNSLSFLGYHDSLTGLWNRNRYVEYLVELRRRKVSSLGIAVADINALKDINKYRGHIEGDIVVKRAAVLLSKGFPNAQIFRLSGDEFAVYSESIDSHIFDEQVEAVRQNDVDLGAYGISIGAAWAHREHDYSRLITQATDIMTMQKREFYKCQHKEHRNHKWFVSQQEELMEHLRVGHFQMYLQPKATCGNFRLNGAEALVRFYSAEVGLIPPDRFIPRLEEEHLIQFIDIYIFEEVCKLLERWKKEGRKLFPISLNFSRQTVLDPGLLKDLLKITEKYQAPRKYIEVEITESYGDYDNATIAKISEDIKAAGFQLALDDFGSHYTNMAMLANVPVDVLKLDRSMIQGVMSSNSNQLVLKSILLLCRDLGIYSLAEGVETEEQLELLKSLQCDSIQGYLFGKPMPVKQFEKEYM